MRKLLSAPVRRPLARPARPLRPGAGMRASAAPSGLALRAARPSNLHGVDRDAFLVGRPRRDAVEIGRRDVADADAIVDRPTRQVASRMSALVNWSPIRYLRAVRQRHFDMPELLAEILRGLADHFGRVAVDVREALEAGGGASQRGLVESSSATMKKHHSGHRAKSRGLDRHQRNIGTGIGARQVGDDRSALPDREVAVLQQRDLLPRIELGVFRGLGLARARQDRLAAIVQPEFVQRPMRRGWSAMSPRPTASASPAWRHHFSTEGRRSSSWLQPSRLCWCRNQ